MSKRFWSENSIACDDFPIVQRAIDAGEAAAQRQGARIDDVIIEVSGNYPLSVIPEYGVGGNVTGDRSFRIDIDPETIHKKHFVAEVARLTTHEYNHLERMRLGHAIVTLRDALVSEGLAVASEIQAGHKPAIYSSFRMAGTEELYTALVKSNLDTLLGRGDKPYGYWFIGHPNNPDIPRHAGSALGFKIVDQFMKENRLTLQETMEVSSQEIVGAWLDKPPRPSRPPVAGQTTPGSRFG